MLRFAVWGAAALGGALAEQVGVRPVLLMLTTALVAASPLLL